MKNLPSPRFQETEADQLIASFGKKPSTEKQQELMSFLKDQKDRFVAQERTREIGSKSITERSI